MELQSPQLNELFTALAKAQGEYKIAGKNNENPFFKSSYASYEDLVAATRPALLKHGLSVVGRMITKEGQKYFHLILGHSSGQYIISETDINPPKSDIQSQGSYRSYQQRYAYRELTGVVVSDDVSDDDGEAVMQRNAGPSGQFITLEQQEIIEQELKDEIEIKKDMLSKLKIHSLNQIPKASFSSILNRIREIKAIK
jgi:hypothetical protein